MMADVENGTGTALDDTFQESFDAGDTTATSALTEDSGVEDPVLLFSYCSDVSPSPSPETVEFLPQIFEFDFSVLLLLPTRSSS